MVYTLEVPDKPPGFWKRLWQKMKRKRKNKDDRIGPDEFSQLTYSVNTRARNLFTIAQIENGFLIYGVEIADDNRDQKMRFVTTLKEIPDALAVMAVQLRLDV